MKQILYIDDDAHSGILLKIYLEKAGFSVLVCRDTRKARNILAGNKIDCIITDVGLPGESGLGFYEWLQKSDFKSIPILIVSAHAIGFDHILVEHKDIFLEKPILFPLLIDRLNKIFGKKKD
ncbi:MAG: response regulator transcription factor [Calditrichaceae bacterium]